MLRVALFRVLLAINNVGAERLEKAAREDRLFDSVLNFLNIRRFGFQSPDPGHHLGFRQAFRAFSRDFSGCFARLRDRDHDLVRVKITDAAVALDNMARLKFHCHSESPEIIVF